MASFMPPPTSPAGLLGHLGEMLGDAANNLEPLQLARPASPLPGALELLAAGYASLAPANRRAWSLLDPLAPPGQPAQSASTWENQSRKGITWPFSELLVDPQTCGPLLISVTLATALLEQPNQLAPIGRVTKPPMN